MNNPFVVLGIMKSEATALKGLSPLQRVKGLDMLRRYFAWILHPDITEKDGELLAKVNSAIDVLKTGNGFNKYYDEHFKSVPVSVSDDYIITLNRERRYWKNTLDEQVLAQLPHF